MLTCYLCDDGEEPTDITWKTQDSDTKNAGMQFFLDAARYQISERWGGGNKRISTNNFLFVRIQKSILFSYTLYRSQRNILCVPNCKQTFRLTQKYLSRCLASLLIKFGKRKVKWWLNVTL